MGMGGAGLAVVSKTDNSNPINPAALALADRKTHFRLPGIGFGAHGLPLRDAYNHIKGGSDGNDALSLARDFGKKDLELTGGMDWGVRLGHLDIHATGSARAVLLPNAALQTWAQTANGDVGLLTGAERADLIGAAVYSLPTVQYAERVSPGGSPTRIEMGVRAKIQRGIYSHYIVTADDIKNNHGGTPAPELGGGTTITKDGLGLDLGLLVHPRDHNGLSGALLVFNAIEPNFRVTGTDTTGAAVRYNMQPRTIAIGSAYEAGRFVAALDGVDLTRSYGDMQGRFGLEYTTQQVSYRAGYASARGFTVGLGWRSLQIAVGAKAPLEIAQTLRF